MIWNSLLRSVQLFSGFASFFSRLSNDFSTAHDWEKEAFAFSSKNSLKILIPYLPTSNPQLRSSVYGEALRELIESKEYERYLFLIKSWPRYGNSEYQDLS